MTRKRLSHKQVKMAFADVLERDGYRCYICGRRDRPLELDHRDGDPFFNPIDGSNWGAACGPCNKDKGPARGAGKRGLRARHMLSTLIPGTRHRKGSVENEGVNKGMSGGESEVERLAEGDYGGEHRFIRSMTAEMKRNIESESKFRECCWKLLREFKVLSVKEMVNAGAEHAGCSQQSCRRYLDKLCSLIGPMEMVVDPSGEKMIRLKQSGVPPVQPPDVSQQGTEVPEA